MSKPTHRDFLAGTVGVGAVVMLPIGASIPSLTPIETLSSLAAEDKYASVVHGLPWDVNTAGFRFSFNDAPLPEKSYIEEIYAPGDESGWAIVIEYTERTEDKPSQRSTRLVHGNWKMWREDVG